MTSLSYTLWKALLEQLIALEFASDDMVHEDYAVKIMEQTSATLEKLSSDQLKELASIMKELEFVVGDSASRDFISSFFENYNLLDKENSHV